MSTWIIKPASRSHSAPGQARNLRICFGSSSHTFLKSNNHQVWSILISLRLISSAGILSTLSFRSLITPETHFSLICPPPPIHSPSSNKNDLTQKILLKWSCWKNNWSRKYIRFRFFPSSQTETLYPFNHHSIFPPLLNPWWPVFYFLSL